jgi:DNA-binding response OmpR family regulator
VPIFITTNYQDFSHAIEGYKYALLDYLVKPVSFEILVETLKRCEEILLQNRVKQQMTIDASCRYDKSEKNLHIDDTMHHLPYGESLVFEYLISHRGKLVETLELENLLFEKELSPTGLKNIIYKLRQKLPPECIVNISKTGYLLK